MKKARDYLERLSERLELPRTIAAGLPQTAINGFRELSIDLQQGLLAYSDTEIVVAVCFGSISVTGAGLGIRLMKEGRITITGEIDRVEFQRGDPV